MINNPTSETAIFEEKAEMMLTPVQRAMATAQFEVIKHKPDFLAAGVDTEIVEKAAYLAVKRVEKEFTETEKTSPLIRLQTALEAVVAPGQEHWLDRAEVNLQGLADKIAQENSTASIAAEREGKSHDPLTHFRNLAVFQHAPDHVNLISAVSFDAPLPKTLEATLHAIGVLKPQETIGQLQNTVPLFDEGTPNRAGQSDGKYYNLPTMVEGVTAYFDPLRYNISLHLTPEAVVKSLPPDTSK